MNSQEHIPIAANVLGTIGTVCWCIQLVPQVWTNWRRKQTDGLPGLMVLLWAICAPPFGVYAVVQKFNVPLQIQPHVFCALALVNWAQVLVYHDGWKAWKAGLLATGIGAAFAGIEVLLILTLEGPYARGITWPIMMIGIIASILLAAGLIPPYFEIWKRKGRVVGINFLFLGTDWMGALLSLMALVAQQTFDIIGGVLYILCMVLEAGIFINHWVWLFRTRKVRSQAKKAGKSYDAFVLEDWNAEPSSPTASPAEANDKTELESGGVLENGEAPPVPPSDVPVRPST
ncbi:MAG: hypothetical protein M4579_000380 [Chaenotheca gracillima]|nr:MAG: hypothetical protein M4579_000380 [Chaenotheca gracillima]